MAWKFLPSLAAAAFAAILFRLFSRGGDQARSTEESASGNDGTAGGASSTHTSTEGQEVATSSGYDYEVFLSFRGPDTRAGFTDFLYTSLKDAGIRTFRDDEELRVGEKFAPELLQAIEQSKISIPIFSKGYASSPWCLNELVQMVECQKNGRQKIMPIFYDVAPSVVRHQIEDYAKAFRSHEKKQRKKQRYDEETIPKWKAALSAVGAINGWDLSGKTNSTRREGEFAKEVTEKVFKELKMAQLVVSDCMVSADNQVGKIMAMIDAQAIETWIIGIHGMGGIGKTTIAKIIYNQLSSNFKDCCFLSNIRETSKVRGIACLHNQLITDILKIKQTDINNEDQGIETIKKRLSNKRVLLLLDDVEKVDHIDAFVGNRDWFGKGSKIIITTRNEDILHVPNVDQRYKVECMDHDQSLQLFSKHAFRRDYPLDEDMVQSNRAICIAGGLPLALEVIGSLLHCIEKKKWDGKLKELENIPPEDVLSKLKISYEALRDHEQRIFLDIACLFIGYEKDILIYFWESRFFPKEAIDVLENRSLMKIDDDNKVRMHDQLRDLGREIVRRESKYKIEEQNRVWDLKEGLDLLRSQKMKEKLEALRLPLDRRHCFSYEDFRRLPNLKFLEVCDSNETSRNKSLSSVLPTDVFQENSDLLPELRWLAWPNISPTFKIMNFSMKNVVILDLSKSRIMHNWEGWSHMKVMKNLKVMDLSYCHYLKRTPDFSAHSKLERLILKVLYMNTFPDLSNLTNLKKLELEFGGCDSDEESNGPVEMPLRIENLRKLETLDLRSPYVIALPTNIGSLLSQLKSLELWCPNLSKLESPYGTALPDISLLPRLKHLLLRCPNLDCLPSLPSSLSSLQLESECVTALPTISLLPQLEELHLECPNLRCLPSLPSGLSSLWLESKCVTTLPTDISTLLPRLGFLKLLCCPNLGDLPSLPSSLSCLWLENGKSCRSMGDLSNLKTLAYLEITECAISEIQGLDRLENLKTLELRKLQWVEILPDLRNLDKLFHLKVSDCGNLVEIQGKFPSSLRALEILDCGSLQKLPDLSSLKELPSILLKRCEKVDVEAIYSLYPYEVVESEGDDIEFDDESEGEDDESGCESEYGSEGEDWGISARRS